MNEDVEMILSVGTFCSNLLQDPTFQSLQALYENSCVAETLTTKPHEVKLREFQYTKVIAFREFTDFLKKFVKQKDQAIEPEAQDHLDIIDDPGVHNINDQDYVD